MKTYIKAGTGHPYFRLKHYWKKYKNMLGIIAFALFMLFFTIHMIIPGFAVILNNYLRSL